MKAILAWQNRLPFIKASPGGLLNWAISLCLFSIILNAWDWDLPAMRFHWLDNQDPTSFSVQSAPQTFLNLIFPDVVWWVCPNTLLWIQMPWVKWLWAEMVELSASHFVAADTRSTHGEWLGEIGAAHCPRGSPQSKLHISTKRSNWAGDFYCCRITHGIISMHRR